jgi:hypothetical protein
MLWRFTAANNDYRVCNTYPKMLVVPGRISDEELALASNFRSGHRLPVMCWGDKGSGATMWRSSQPKAGVSGSCMQDEKLLDAIAQSCEPDSYVHICIMSINKYLYTYLYLCMRIYISICYQSNEYNVGTY